MIPPPVVQPPPAPTNLRAAQVTRSRVDASWLTALTYQTYVERALNGAPFGQVAITPPGTMHVTLQARKKDSMILRVRAFDGSRFSDYSGLLYYSSQ